MAYVSIYEHPAFAAIHPQLTRAKRAAIARRRMAMGAGVLPDDPGASTSGSSVQTDTNQPSAPASSDGSSVANALSDLFGGGGSTDDGSSSSTTQATTVIYGEPGATSSDGGTGLTIPGPQGQGVQTYKPPPDVKPVIPPGGLPTSSIPTWVWIGGALVLLVGGIVVAHSATQSNPRRGRRRRHNPRANPMRRMHHRRR